MKKLVSFLKRSMVRTMYIRIASNRMHFRHLESGREISLDADPPFTSSRLLVANFSAARHLLQRGIGTVTGGIGLAPVIVFSAGEMTEGGLSESEERLLLDLGYEAGAHYVAAVAGDLSDGGVLEVIKGRSLLRA